MKKTVSSTVVIVISAIFIAFFDNFTFYKKVFEVYPINAQNILFLISLSLVLTLVITLFFVLVNYKYTLKPILILFLIVSSMLNYFMVTYNLIIDEDMIRNGLQTDASESFDLITTNMFLYLVFLGLIPSFIVYKLNIEYKSFKKEIFLKIKFLVSIALIVFIMIFSLSKFYTSFLREHRVLRFYIAPTHFIASIENYIKKTYTTKMVFKTIGDDAKVVSTSEKKKLVIMVVGEAIRSDRMSLNGYDKKTNPLLEKEDVISFTNLYSCGTSTAHSVPCMFSVYDRKEYSYKKGISTENVIDILAKTGDIDVSWRDNNSDSKGVALRVHYEDFKRKKCDGECRDISMLDTIQKRIENNKKRDIFIVLHQMGNHGPAYYKRYPKEFEKFTPVCKTNQLENCTKEEISNAYDNTVLYTDFFLSKTIELLKKNQNEFETALFYMSDHGESLGEGGVYLHGMPYFIAPDVQKHIASFVWFGESSMRKRVNFEGLRAKKNENFSQDNLFHSILGLMEVQTEVYDEKKDIFR